MKKIGLVPVLFLLLSAVCMAQSIDLKKPVGGKMFLMGSKVDVTWTSDAGPGKVRLVLLRFNKKLGVIEKNINKGLGSYSWTAGNFRGGKAVAGSGYKIRIIVQGSDPVVMDTMEKSFGLEYLKLVGPTTQIITPNKESRWAELGTFPIRWKSTSKMLPSRIELYNYNKTKKISTIVSTLVIMKRSEDNTYGYEWTIPKGTYSFPGNFTIRVSSPNSSEAVFSEMFHIDKAVNMVEKSYTLHPTVSNRSHRHYRFKCASVDDQGTSFPPGPGEGICKVGYENNWKQWGPGNVCHRHLCFIHRSFIYFDMKDFAQGRIIKKATLFLKKLNTDYSDGHTATNNHPGHCGKNLYVVDAPWTSPFDVEGTALGGIETAYDITPYARDWALKGINHGLMLVGINESFNKNNAHCLSYYTATLVVRSLENQ